MRLEVYSVKCIILNTNTKKAVSPCIQPTANFRGGERLPWRPRYSKLSLLDAPLLTRLERFQGLISTRGDDELFLFDVEHLLLGDVEGDRFWNGTVSVGYVARNSHATRGRSPGAIRHVVPRTVYFTRSIGRGKRLQMRYGRLFFKYNCRDLRRRWFMSFEG